MDIRQVSSPTETKTFDTKNLRENYLVETLFLPDQITMTYSHLDRTVIGGAMPVDAPLKLKSNKQIGSPGFFDCREMGIINVGGSGSITADNISYDLQRTDCLYLPMGTADVSFESDSAADPARFYFISTPAHHAYTAMKITAKDANRLELGSQSDANGRGQSGFHRHGFHRDEGSAVD